MPSRDFAHSDRSRGSSDVVAVIMAAGASRRFGAGDKRRARLPTGQSLLAATVAKAVASFSRLRVVIREEDDPRALGLAADLPIIRARQARDGLGASIAEAFTTLMGDGALDEVTAAAVLLGDMPGLAAETLRLLQRRARRDRIIRPRHAGHPGHPVLFGRDFWPELTALEGDEGARRIIRQHRALYQEIEVSDPGIHLDIDTAADLATAPNGRHPGR